MIREAVLEDIDRLIELGMSFWAGSEYGGIITVSPKALRQTLEQTIESPDSVWLVAEKDGQLIGMIGLACTAHPFSGERVALELAWWVEPEHRSGGVGIKLLKCSEEWAKRQSAIALMMVAPNEEIERLYVKLGYGLVERTFQKNL